MSGGKQARRVCGGEYLSWNLVSGEYLLKKLSRRRVWGAWGGGGGTPQSFIWEDTVLKSSPFPFYTSFFAQKYPFRMSSIDKWNRYMMGKWSLQPF